MRAIPVDTSRVSFVATGKGAARAEYVELADGSRKRSGNQATDDNGVPVWVVDVLVDDPDADRAEIAGVKVSSHDEPSTQKWQPVRFAGLLAVPYVDNGGRVALSWRADGIEGQGTGKRQDHKPAGEHQPAA